MLTENQLVEQITKSTPIGMLIVLTTNIAAFAIGYMLGKNNNPTLTTQYISIILAIIAIGEIGVAYMLKKKMLEPVFAQSETINMNTLAQIMTKTSIVLAAICATPPIYGIVAVILGAKTEFVAGFMIISLGGYMLLRLRPRDFGKLISQE
jgi:hypothetical protein